MGVINFTKANCRNCYKCIRYCPVKAIKLIDNQAQIVGELCIGCGNCFRICPQNAKYVASDVERIQKWLEEGSVVLSLAPSFPAAFDLENPLTLLSGLKALGFKAIEETAIGAEAVSKYYAKDYWGNKRHVITTSCPTVNMMVEKYYPQAVDYLSAVESPMIAHGRMLKEKYPEARVVFAGPCISKKMETAIYAEGYAVDGVLTFDELDLWLKAEKINLGEMPAGTFDAEDCNIARFYPLAGGVEKSSIPGVQGLRRAIKIDGLKNCRDFLDDIHKLEGQYWVEMNACVEGCINGPGNTHCDLVKYERIERVTNYINRNARKDAPEVKRPLTLQKTFKAAVQDPFANISQESIEEILHQTGKFTVKDELNCGTCGYDSCREKAAAVYCGMAELDMCLPFMRNRNEAISNLIIASTPNAIAVLDQNYSILDFNAAAEKLFKTAKADVIQKNFVDIFDYNPFKKLNSVEGNSYSGRGYYSAGNIHFMEILTYIPGQKMYMGIFVDISREIKKEQSYQKMQGETLDMAQKVIDKQMRVAHEIAELLGETTAETKVTLTRLKKVVGTREEEE